LQAKHPRGGQINTEEINELTKKEFTMLLGVYQGPSAQVGGHTYFNFSRIFF
jgi:hypothetical protein